MQETCPSGSLGFLFADTARLLRKRFDQRAREFGLTRAQWQVLAQLSHNQGIKQAGLADLLEIEPITLSRHIDKMEEAGWVSRRPDPNDRRARLLYLTANSGPLLEKMREIGRRLMDEAMAGLPEGRREIMFETLTHLRAALSDRSVPEEGSAAGDIPFKRRVAS
jgi:MarR family transcriptional regulator for hemolysin